jgi:hypothetical protein
MKKKVTNFGDELYISAIVGSAIPITVDFIKYLFYGFDPKNGVTILESTFDVYKESFLKGTLATCVDGIYFKVSEKHNLSKTEALARAVSRIAVRSANFLIHAVFRHSNRNHKAAYFLSYLPGIIYIAAYTPSFY